MGHPLRSGPDVRWNLATWSLYGDLQANLHPANGRRPAGTRPNQLRIGRSAHSAVFLPARQYCDSWGDDKFAVLRFRVDGNSLIIDRHPDPESVWRRYKMKALREAVSYALSRDAGSQNGQPDRSE